MPVTSAIASSKVANIFFGIASSLGLAHSLRVHSFATHNRFSVPVKNESYTSGDAKHPPLRLLPRWRKALRVVGCPRRSTGTMNGV